MYFESITYKSVKCSNLIMHYLCRIFLQLTTFKTIFKNYLMFHIFNLQLIPSPFCPSRYIALIRRIVQSEYIDVVSSSYLVK